MSNFCVNCGALLEDMTCDRCECALDSLAALQPATEPAQAGGATGVAPSGEKLGVIEEMQSTLISSERPPHEVTGLGMWWMHEGKKILMFESSVVSDVQHELSITLDELAKAQTGLASAESRLRQAEAALKPFAKAYKDVPEGLRSTLRIWDGEDGIIHLSATTDDLEAAADLARESEE